MGILDIFGKEPKSKNELGTRTELDFSQPIDVKEEKKGPVSILIPTSFDDVEKIIDTLKSGKTAVVHLNNLKIETQIRVIDMLSGAIYALGGGVYEMEKNVFMFSPLGVEIL